ncbi:MAG TPA: hypothetical protein VFX45_10620 [Solirubrobacterales bacterium]|nr:hypothetical protein [Solirubrobacterales bacterium]
MRPKLTFANAIALIALFISLGGTVYAAAKINGKTIRKASIPADRFQPDALTGVQIAESSLETVPKADKVVEAAAAARADSVPRVREANEAQTAAFADRVPSARTAPAATHSRTADAAAFAQVAEKLGGRAPGAYLDDCGNGAVKGYVLFDPQAPGNHKVAEYNCAGGVVQVQKNAGASASYNVTFTGATGANMGITNAFGLHSLSGVDFANGIFRVFIDHSEGFGRDLSREPFSLIVF